MTKFLSSYKEVKTIKKGTKILVLLNLGKEPKSYVPLEALRVSANDSDTVGKKISTLEELKSALAENKLYIRKGKTALAQQISRELNKDIKLFEEELKLPDTYVSTEYQGVDKDGKATAIQNGLKRQLKVKEDGVFTDKDVYVYCKLAGETNMQFVPASDLAYIKDGKYVDLVGSSLKLKDLEGKQVYSKSKNIVVEVLYYDKAIKFGEVVNSESVNLDKLTRHTFDVAEDGAVTDADEEIDRYYTEQVCRKDENGSYLDAYNYSVSANGNFIKVIYDGQNIETMVRVSDLYKVDEFGNASDTQIFTEANPFNDDTKYSLIGKKVAVKGSDGVVRITEPLTFNQLSLAYSKLMSMQETTDEKNVLGEDTYIKLIDGRYIKEAEIAHPLCYDFTDNENDFDAFYVIVKTADGKEKGVIIDKDAFKGKTNFIKDGMSINQENAYRIKRSKRSMKDCDVIQTTKQGKFAEESVAINKLKVKSVLTPKEEHKFKDLTNEEKETLINSLQSNFIQQYKKGEYVLDSVLDDKGEFIEVREDHKRYIYTDHVTMHDYSNDTSAYKHFNGTPLTYDSEQGKLSGGKTFDVKKANKVAFKKYKSILGTSFSFLLHPVGVIGVALLGTAITGMFMISPLLATQILAIGIPVLLAAPAVIIPIVNAIRGAVINRKFYKHENKLKLQRKGLAKEIQEEFELIYDETKLVANMNEKSAKNRKKKSVTSEMYHGKALNKNVLLDRFEQIDQRIISMCEGKLFSDFRMVAGKGTVTESNIELFSKYKEEMTSLEKEIRILEKEVKKDPSKQAELDMKKSQYEKNLKDYVSQGIIEPKDKKMQALLDQSQILKGFLIQRYYSGELDKDRAKELDTLYNKYIKNGKFAELEILAEKYEEGKLSKKEEKEFKKLKGLISLLENCKTSGVGAHFDYGANIVTVSAYEGATTSTVINPEVTQVAGVQVEAEQNQRVNADVTQEEVREERLDTPTNPENNGTRRRNSNATTVPKKRLSKANLEKLLSDIDELRRLDKLYYGPDEDIPADLDAQIRAKEKEIEASKHLLGKAINNDKYIAYQDRILEAEKLYKQHKKFMSNTNKINIL